MSGTQPKHKPCPPKYNPPSQLVAMKVNHNINSPELLLLLLLPLPQPLPLPLPSSKAAVHI